VALQRTADPSVWAASGAYTPVLGDWRMDVVVQRSPAPDAAASFSLPVAEPIAPQRVPPPDVGLGVPAPIGMLWSVLPAGPMGWSPTLALLVLAAALALVARARRGQRSTRFLGIARNSVLLAALALGIVVGVRSTVAAANAVPAAARDLSNPVAADPASVERGRQVYLANCSACHGVRADGGGPTAPDIVPRPGTILEAVRAATPGELYYRITNGYVGTPMPAFSSSLTESERWDLVNYLRSLGHAPGAR
jgi:mono/diheme cytochrome c family protein